MLVDQIKEWFSQQPLAAPTSEQPLLLAVSGGADSMALAFLMRDAFGLSALAIMTVDHGLRSGGYAEARWTKAQLDRHGFQVFLQRLELQPASGNTQARARLARYVALRRRAQELGAYAIATAHTLEDQAETVFARLARASGTRGLSAMRGVASIPGETQEDGIVLARPLLGVSRDALRDYLRARDLRWAEDPSNRLRTYDRVRFRRLLEQWTQAGFDISRIAKSAEHLGRSDDALEYYADRAVRTIVTTHDDGSVDILRGDFCVLPDDVQLRVLRRFLCAVSRVDSPIRFEKLERARTAILRGKRDIFTLHHTKITVETERFLIQAE
ncbi:MAG: tRNA lysidine(34) synthetase TilS [Pseudomonadota bacterium]